ncbi:MAG: WD40 repeat domain-containing protein, partial [Planctomycetales bacterium]|nr:WD40 repeat domain-containing protein [Planctomycetales bacterium]
NHIEPNFTQTAISRDGRFYALAEHSARNPICIVNAKSHDVVLRVSEAQDQVATLSLSHDGRRLAIGYANGVIAVPEMDDISNGPTKSNRKRLFQAHQGALTAVRFIDDRRFVSAGTDGLLKYWELPREKMSVSMSNTLVGDIVISPDDQTLAYLDDQGFQLQTVEGKHLANMPCKTAHRVCFSRDSAAVAFCDDSSNSVYLLSAATGKQLLHISLPSTLRDICMSPTEDHLAVIDGNVSVWNTKTGHQVADALALYDEREYRDYRCLYSPDGRTLICHGLDVIVSIDVATMTPIRRDPMLIRQFSSCFSSDGTWFAVALSNGTIELWRWPSFEHFGSLHGHRGEVRDIAFTQDDRLISIGQDGTTRIWSPSQLREIGILARSPHVSECFALTANAARMWIGYNTQTEPGDNPVMLELLNIEF